MVSFLALISMPASKPINQTLIQTCRQTWVNSDLETGKSPISKTPKGWATGLPFFDVSRWSFWASNWRPVETGKACYLLMQKFVLFGQVTVGKSVSTESNRKLECCKYSNYESTKWKINDTLLYHYDQVLRATGGNHWLRWSVWGIQCYIAIYGCYDLHSPEVQSLNAHQVTWVFRRDLKARQHE